MAGRKRSHASLRWTVLGLAVASVTLLLLPRRWTGSLISVVQLLIPFQDAAGTAIDAAGNALDSNEASVPSEAYEALALQRDAYGRQLAAASMRVADLEREVAMLTATRAWQVDSSRIGTRGRLIPARMIAGDLLAWRDSRLLMAGMTQGARRGDAVTTARFSLAQGESAGLRNGLAVLLSEALIGWVDQVGTHTSRVRLVSDMGVEMKVRLGRFHDHAFVPSDRYYWLVGKGRGVMELRDVERRDLEGGLVQAGDTVLSDTDSETLPAAMTLGTVTRIDPDHNNPLLAVATVAAAVPPSTLRKVYIFDPRTPTE